MYYHGHAIKFNMMTLLRDYSIYLCSVSYIVIIFWDYQITVWDSLLLVAAVPVYLLYSIN